MSSQEEREYEVPTRDKDATVYNLEVCGCCNCYHRPEFYGDCRNDAERFAIPEDVIEAIKKRKPQINIPLCHKCSSKILQPDLFKNCLELVGCKELTKAQWEEGNRQDDDKSPYYQHNCPILPKK